ncbi:MAG: HAD hydrolase-like protein [Verrucomicrobiota bacterium]
MIRLILFDIDGTLIRTGGAGVEAFERTFASEFDLLNATRDMKFAGRTDPSLVREGFTRHGIEASAENFTRFFETYVCWLQKLMPHSNGQVCPGVSELLRALGELPAPPLIGLLTGNIRAGARIKLAHYRLWDQFAFGAFGDDNECRNELAGVAQRRASDLLGRKITGDEIVVIGDTPLDVACANAIHARVLAVATGGYRLEDLQSCRPTWAVESLAHMQVEQLWQCEDGGLKG